MLLFDDWAGIPVCVLLTFWHYVSFPLRQLKKLARRIPSSPPGIAVIKFLGMGSIILISPMIRQLRAVYPSARIVFVTFSSNRRIVELLNIADEVLSVRTDNFVLFVWDTLALLVKLRARRVEMVLDCEFFAKYSVMVSYLSGARIRAGYYVRELWRKKLLTHHAFYNHFKHAQENFGMLLRTLGIDFQPVEVLEPPRLPVPETAFKSLKKHALAIAINVNASELITLEMRRWPKEYFSQLCVDLLDSCDCELWFVGAPNECPYVEKVIGELCKKRKVPDRIVNWTGKTTIDELAALLKASDFVVANDSGIMHVAALVGTKVCAVFGAETPLMYSPLGKGHIIFSQQELYCHPCLHVYNRKQNLCIFPEKYACLRRTTPGQVFRVIKTEWLERKI